MSRAPRMRGIVCSADEVRDLPAGRVTQLRRPVDEKRLRVRLPGRVTSDPICAMIIAPIVAPPGTYHAQMNPYGAVSIDVGGRWLGVKPGEFHFVCPYADGETVNVDIRSQPGRHPWLIAQSRSGWRWVKEAWACVERRSDSVSGIRFVADGAFYPIDNTRAWCAAVGKVPLGCCRAASILPRWASRLNIELGNVELQRVGNGWQWIVAVLFVEKR